MQKQGYIERKVSDYIKYAASLYPVVTLCGPRQAGKTTLALHLFPDYDYVSMEDPDVRTAFYYDPRGFLEMHAAPCIFDEVQNTPELLSYMQGIVDRENKRGMYILTGSRQMELQQNITQSLAGRTAIVDVLPLSLAELQVSGKSISRNDSIFCGGLPRVHAEQLPPTMAYSDYFRTYVERDVRQIINVRNMKLFETFVCLLASRVGQVINYSSLAGDVGVSSSTIKEWISLLEASYIIFTLRPYHKNYGKRLTKSPKIYFTESGLICSLLGIKSADQVGRDPLIGNIYENLVVSEILKAQCNAGQRPDLYFFRDSNGFEVDLVLEQNRCPLPIEIKSAFTFNPEMCKNLKRFSEWATDALTPVLVYAGNPMGTLNGVRIMTSADVHTLVNE